VNSLGVLLVYEGVWDKEGRLSFALVFPRREENTRVTYVGNPDGTVRMTSERPGKQGECEIYFETVLSRAGDA